MPLVLLGPAPGLQHRCRGGEDSSPDPTPGILACVGCWATQLSHCLYLSPLPFPTHGDSRLPPLPHLLLPQAQWPPALSSAATGEHLYRTKSSLKPPSAETRPLASWLVGVEAHGSGAQPT